MSIRGGKGKNRRGQPDNPISSQGYAVSYHRRLVNCGNPRCKQCLNGPSHGPYLYERFRDADGKTHTVYRGRVNSHSEAAD